mmetsp:Transcript_44542/g.148628  ORF Transcript_44542/g.148628 Transcript_44542/m.148628 type:complete len:112 (-) Transcript_44542:123-458(-)
MSPTDRNTCEKPQERMDRDEIFDETDSGEGEEGEEGPEGQEQRGAQDATTRTGRLQRTTVHLGAKGEPPCAQSDMRRERAAEAALQRRREQQPHGRRSLADHNHRLPQRSA